MQLPVQNAAQPSGGCGGAAGRTRGRLVPREPVAQWRSPDLLHLHDLGGPGRRPQAAVLSRVPPRVFGAVLAAQRALSPV